ncbi:MULTISPECIES: hypothetical protein [unclassified Stenotrophomonas]|uniref:hypothetical protein n=1 Tax=unclassified Stenotrophomonas TaxID=196198 RepID=UPI0021191CF5|nr:MULTISPECIES: hypothetical protein [unclassified Stenotrophomonas]
MSHPPDHEDAAHAALRRVRREGRWWWLQARHARRVWRWVLPIAALVFIALVMLRGPLANWFWNEPQIEQLLDQGDRALAAGRLSADDGTGARELYQAALALDGDRSQARTGLARTAQAALQQGREALDRGDIEAAQRGLALARALQVPQRDAEQLAQRLAQRGTAHAGIAVLLGRAEAALQAQRLDGDLDSALPLFQQVLAVAPNQLRALEGREDALSDLLQQARDACGRGDLARASALLGSARGYDPGHVDLPVTQEALNNALEARLRQANQALRRQRWDSAAADFQAVLAAAPEDPVARQGLQHVIDAQLANATRLAGDFRFEQADRALAAAHALGATERALGAARQVLAQARQAAQALKTPGAPRAQRERRLRALLARIVDAEARGQFLSPPGGSAYDALREAQALAAYDPRVRAAAQRLLPASRSCFEDRLRENRVQAAGACLEAWQTLSPGEATLSAARRRLAQRWLAIGSERLGAGDLAFAQQALAQARHWQPDLAELGEFEQRLRDAGGPG